MKEDYKLGKSLEGYGEGMIILDLKPHQMSEFVGEEGGGV
jgi:hypothetical protein